MMQQQADLQVQAKQQGEQQAQELESGPRRNRGKKSSQAVESKVIDGEPADKLAQRQAQEKAQQKAEQAQQQAKQQPGPQQKEQGQAQAPQPESGPQLIDDQQPADKLDQRKAKTGAQQQAQQQADLQVQVRQQVEKQGQEVDSGPRRHRGKNSPQAIENKAIDGEPADKLAQRQAQEKAQQKTEQTAEQKAQQQPPKHEEQAALQQGQTLTRQLGPDDGENKLESAVTDSTAIDNPPGEKQAAKLAKQLDEQRAQLPAEGQKQDRKQAQKQEQPQPRGRRRSRPENEAK